MRKPRPMPRNHDANLDNLRTAGRLARLRGEPLRSCPNLAPYFGEARALALTRAWTEGWDGANAELDSSRAAMKGAD